MAMKCVHLVQKSAEWKRWRVEGITATDAPVILGLNPSKTPWRLWAEKVQFLRVPDLSMVPAVRYGVEHEDVARHIYELRTQMLVLPFCATYDEEPIFRASFDGIDDNDEPVEIKCPQANTLADVYANGVNSHAYKLYYPQVQHQMLVAGAKHANLIFYDGEKDDILVFGIDRDEAMIKQILEKGREFYQCVINRKAPARDPTRDMFIPKDPSVISEWMQASAQLTEIEKRHEALKASLESIERETAPVKERLIALMGDSEYTADYGGVYMNKTIATGRVDYKAMVEKLLGREPTEDDVAPFRAPSQIRWRVTSTGVPSREIIDEETLQEIEDNTVEVSGSLWF